MGEFLKKQIENYFKEFTLNEYLSFISYNEIPIPPLSEIETDIKSIKETEKYSSYEKCVLNTSLFPDLFTSRALSSDNTKYTEIGLMILKTYIKQLLPSPHVNQFQLINVFNKNQELVEIPYAIALYLGGLHYFNFIESEKFVNFGEATQTDFSVIKSQKDVFNRINGVASYYQDGTSGNDVYLSNELKPTPSQYIKNATTETVYIPSVRILNRSIYDLYTGDKSKFELEYDIKIGYQDSKEVIEKELIDGKSVMPSVGYGIQNKFLNVYNNVMFGDYLNGSSTSSNDGMPHVITGAYCGISKPIKTYDSYETEFTAFYRNLFVGSFNYEINTIKSDLDKATKGLTTDFESNDGYSLTGGSSPNLNKTIIDKSNNNNILFFKLVELQEKGIIKFNTFREKIIKSFIAYSKLKANYLSGSIINQNDLKEKIKILCSVKNIKSKFNIDRKKEGKHEVSDFYYLISHFFFASFKQIKPHLNYGDKTLYSIESRLNFGTDSNFYRGYQSNNLTNKLDRILNENINSLDDEINALTNFLNYIWLLEKNNLKPKFSIIDSDNNKAVFAIYPSAGGFVSPAYLAYTDYPSDGNTSTGVKLDLTFKNNISSRLNSLTGYLHSNNGKPSIDKGDPQYKSYGELGKDNLINANSVLVDVKDKNIYNQFVPSTEDNQKNPCYPYYYADKTVDRYNFLTKYSFNNEIILKNTTRFFWFDSTVYGAKLKEDRVRQDLKNIGGFILNDNGVDESIKPYCNYFTHNYLNIHNYHDTVYCGKNDYFDQFKLASLLDMLDFEKLEEFKNLFLDFCSFDASATNTMTETTYDLKKLMLASSVFNYDSIQDFTDSKSNITLTKEEINLVLIGNSMYQYEFCAEIGLSKFLNVALTQAQYDVFNNVADEFCSTNITIANYSTTGSIAYNKNAIMSLHKVPALAEILFSNKGKYEDICKLLGYDYTTNDKINLYFTRKILFGEQYVAPFTELTSNEITQLDTLNYSYLINKLFTKEQKNLVPNFNVNKVYRDGVISFFKLLNIKFSRSMYRHLIRLIRSYIYYVFNNNNILDDVAIRVVYNDLALFKQRYHIPDEPSENSQSVIEKYLIQDIGPKY